MGKAIEIEEECDTNEISSYLENLKTLIFAMIKEIMTMTMTELVFFRTFRSYWSSCWRRIIRICWTRTFFIKKTTTICLHWGGRKKWKILNSKTVANSCSAVFSRTHWIWGYGTKQIVGKYFTDKVLLLVYQTNSCY